MGAGTSPAVSINHEEVANLPDSTTAFEGPEKLLEIWFAQSAKGIPVGEGLKSISRTQWEEMLDLVQCKILSTIHSDSVDAYLLSESSMFVFPHKLILKTCGTTTLLVGLPRLIEMAKEVGLAEVYRVFYSRKNFLFPDRQLHPHRSWNDEVQYLDTIFEEGSAYVIGQINGDHWYLYLTTPEVELTDPQGDETLEILMTNLLPDSARQFYVDEVSEANGFHDPLQPHISEGHLLGMQTSRRTGLAELYKAEYPDTKLDAFVFSPCGFSANGVVPGDGKQNMYFTVHVTPEPVCSYASFETNVPSGSSPKDIIDRVISVFKPGKFCVSYFDASHGHKIRTVAAIDGYARKDRILYDLEGYELAFASFEKD